jgi:GT2 family glycosyltransferase
VIAFGDPPPFFILRRSHPRAPSHEPIDLAMNSLSTPELTLAALLATVSFVWLSLVIATFLGLRSMRVAPGASARIGAQPSCTIVLAARDEAERIEQTIRRALAQTGVRLQVIAVDDRSSDDTPKILARLANENEHFVSVRVDALPTGWLGKCHALHEGAKHATGDWLLFIDADTWLEPGAASAGIALAARTGAGHVCFAPAMASTTLPGRATLLAGMSLYAVRALGVHSARMGAYMGVGAYNLIDARTYRSFGGHEALRIDILDDVKLALLANRAGARTRTAFAPELVEVEWAGSARGFVRLLAKNAFATQNYSALRTVFFATAAIVSMVTPIASIAIATLTDNSLLRGVALACIAAYLAGVLPAAIIARRFGWGLGDALLAPFGHWVVLAAGVNSAVCTLRAGGVSWRETFYPIADLRKGLVR